MGQVIKFETIKESKKMAVRFNEIMIDRIIDNLKGARARIGDATENELVFEKLCSMLDLSVDLLRRTGHQGAGNGCRGLGVILEAAADHEKNKI